MSQPYLDLTAQCRRINAHNFQRFFFTSTDDEVLRANYDVYDTPHFTSSALTYLPLYTFELRNTFVSGEFGIPKPELKDIFRIQEKNNAKEDKDHFVVSLFGHSSDQGRRDCHDSKA